MALNLGATAVGTLKVGSADVSKVMLGDVQVWPAAPANPTPWTPADIATDIWLDASQASTLTVSGNKITEWRDAKGNGFKVVQADSTKQPDGSTAGRVLFDGQTLMTALVSKFSGKLDFAWVAVASKTDSRTGALFMERSIDVAAEADPSVTLISTDTTLINRSGGVDPGTVADANEAYAWANGAWHIVGADSEASQGIAYRDGAQTAANNTAKQATTFQPLRIGASYLYSSHQVLESQYWHGEITEFIALPARASTEVRQRLEGYLAWKAGNESLGLVAKLPENHPYKSAPPTK